MTQGRIITGSTIDQDCVGGRYLHVSPGVHIAGTVSVGSRTWLGIGSTVSNNVRIVPDCIVGAGAVVVKDVFFKGTYLRIPARRVRDRLCNQ